MALIRIEGVNNKKFKLFKSLSQKKYRKENSLFLVEGKKLCGEADGLLKATIISESYTGGIFEGIDNFLLSDDLFSKLSYMEQSEGIIGLCEFASEEEIKSEKILVLDSINDPGNFGTLIRSAEAFGFSDIILLGANVDKYNPKVIRASMGSIFRTNIVERDLDFLAELKEKGYKLLATYLDPSSKSIKGKTFDKLALIIGNESHGIRDEIIEITDEKLIIEMLGKNESLNAAIAGSIAMYELS